ncbi:hypothetical protein C3V38_14450 [Dietzia sp. oral taxon 368]|uniref:hypothetical protein n=1 Tax=Dietzia sp. oral taxon 368 TaxID=712270 RepID=UPI000D08C401|nr:hypothetical protein [Dietzia sp. oral taxon 368]AVM65391.1 hypothetical protein C3V38_14450 [Dietzia sp. oral taxon 368]
MTAPMAWPYGEAAAALRKAVGPVPRSEYPDLAVARAVARIGDRALESGEVVVTDHDLRTLATEAAAMRPPHPFVYGY